MVLTTKSVYVIRSDSDGQTADTTTEISNKIEKSTNSCSDIKALFNYLMHPSLCNFQEFRFEFVNDFVHHFVTGAIHPEVYFKLIKLTNMGTQNGINMSRNILCLIYTPV